LNIVSSPLSAKEKALQELELLKQKGMEIQAKEVLIKNMMTIPKF
jgi:hypothetical protein